MSDATRDAWLADVEADLMSSAPAAIPPSLGGLGEGGLNIMQMALGEGRTPEKYRQGVGQYIDECRETWRGAEWDDFTLPKPPKPYGSQTRFASLDDADPALPLHA